MGFGLQNQTDRIGSTTIDKIKPGITNCFGTKFSRNNPPRRSLDYMYPYEFPAPEHLSARRISFAGGARDNTPCALYARTVGSPLAPVYLVRKQSVADGGCRRPRYE